MARGLDVTQWQDELVDACKRGDESRARSLVDRLGVQPRKARALLEAMLEDPDALVRQAAAFGLGELGGATSARRLEQQLPLEEARADYDGDSVVEAITQALGRIEEASARAGLVRRLKRLASDQPDVGDLNTLARALWRRRHPDLLPVVRQSLEQLPLAAPTALHGLLVLLEKSPEALRTWAADSSVAVEEASEVLWVLTEDVPDVLVPSLSAFISKAHALLATAKDSPEAASDYCEALLSLLLRSQEHLIPRLPDEVRSELRALALKLVATTTLLNCSLRAAALLKFVGNPGDAALLDAHRPAEPVLAKVFEDAAQALRQRLGGS